MKSFVPRTETKNYDLFDSMVHGASRERITSGAARKKEVIKKQIQRVRRKCRRKLEMNECHVLNSLMQLSSERVKRMLYTFLVI